MKYRDPETGEFKDIYVKASDTLPIGAEVYYDGDTIPSGWEEVNDMLWENPDTNVAFKPQNITLSSSNYNNLLIGYYAHYTRDRILKTIVVPKGYTTKITSSEGATFGDRTITYNNDTSLSISTANYYGTFGSQNPTSTSNNIIIPVFVKRLN